MVLASLFAAQACATTDVAAALEEDQPGIFSKMSKSIKNLFTGEEEKPKSFSETLISRAANSSDACQQRIEGVAGFLGANQQGAGLVGFFNDKTESDDMLSGVIVSRSNTRGIMLNTLDVAVAEGGDCQASYETIKTWMDDCPTVVKNAYGKLDYQFKGKLNNSIDFYERPSGQYLFVWPLPQAGCISVQKEIIY